MRKFPSVSIPPISRHRRSSGALLLVLLLSGNAGLEATEKATDDRAAAASPAAAPPEATTPREGPVDETEGEEPLIVDDYLEVLDTAQPIATIEILSPDDLPAIAAGDGADLLRGVAGVSLGRMGGHGLEPRIRGLGEASLNVLVDGAFIHGGCPNRMDPPTSFAATSGFDRVTVIKGVQTLRHGAGGSAGTVLYERLPPDSGAEEPWRLEAQSVLGGWLERPGISFDTTWAAERFYLRAEAESRDFDSYEDGSGEIVRSAYESKIANLMTGFGDRERGLFEVGYEHSRTDDALFAGAGMDSPEDRGNTFRLRFRRAKATGAWSHFETDLYLSQVDHLMDNYSLRLRTAPMALRVPSTSDTSGGRASARRRLGAKTELTLGLDHQQNEREALRFAGPSAEAVDRLQSVMWPQAELSQSGLFVEGERGLLDGARLRFALRYDAFSASAGAADRQPVGGNLSPNELYRLYYGRPAEDWSDGGVSALLRYERRLGPGWTFFTGASRSLRAADATERYLGASNPTPSRRWVGNPRLETAAHRQLDVGLARTDESYRWSATAFFDSARDFILRDRARLQEGIVAADGASVYRNVDARRIGLDIDATWLPSSAWTFRGNASWVRGDNRTDRRPLAQIPALQGQLVGAWARDRWRATTTWRWALEQDRVDDDPRFGGGLDYGPTPGHSVIDVEGVFRWRPGLEVALAVDNFLDKAYAQHLNRGNLFDPDPVRTNEPGRAVWLRLRWRAAASDRQREGSQ